MALDRYKKIEGNDEKLHRVNEGLREGVRTEGARNDQLRDTKNYIQRANTDTKPTKSDRTEKDPQIPKVEKVKIETVKSESPKSGAEPVKTKQVGSSQDPIVKNNVEVPKRVDQARGASSYVAVVQKSKLDALPKPTPNATTPTKANNEIASNKPSAKPIIEAEVENPHGLAFINEDPEKGLPYVLSRHVSFTKILKSSEPKEPESVEEKCQIDSEEKSELEETLKRGLAVRKNVYGGMNG